MKRHILTELEGCTLGLIWDMGPCTIYAVRKVLEASPNPYWSGSAGALYPLVRRLKGRGLVSSRVGFRGKRRHVHYSITNKGMTQLRAWIGPPVAEYVSAIPADPIRTRVHFLGAIDASAREELFEVARGRFEREIAVARQRQQEMKSEDDRFKILVPRGVELMAEARLTWLDEVRTHVHGEIRNTGSQAVTAADSPQPPTI